MSSSKIRSRRRWLFAALGAFVGLLAGCTESDFAAQIVPYNHTDQYIDAVYVNGRWGGNSFPHSGGGSFVCCVKLPARPAQGFTVKVGWDDDDGRRHEREVTVPPYDKDAGQLNVHFLRGGEIKVFALGYGLRHPDYPLKGEEANLRAGVPNPEPNYGR